MIIVAKNKRDLSDSIVYLCTNCNHRSYPTEFQTYDEAWTSLFRSLEHLRGKFGQARFSQLVDMATQAKAHYESALEDSNQLRLASRLMQDIEQVVNAKAPFAYPKELYRWPRI